MNPLPEAVKSFLATATVCRDALRCSAEAIEGAELDAAWDLFARSSRKDRTSAGKHVTRWLCA